MLNLRELQKMSKRGKREYNPHKGEAPTLGSNKSGLIKCWGKPTPIVFKLWGRGLIPFQRGSSTPPWDGGSEEGIVYSLGAYAGCVNPGDTLYTQYKGVQCELIPETTVRVPMTWARWGYLQETLERLQVNAVCIKTEVPQHLETTLVLQSPYHEDGRDILGPGFTVSLPKQDLRQIQPWSYQQALSIPQQKVKERNIGVRYQQECIEYNRKRAESNRVYGRPKAVDSVPYYIQTLTPKSNLGEPSLESQAVDSEGNIPSQEEVPEKAF